MEEAEIKRMLEEHGYTFDGIVSFRKSDRIRWHNKTLQVSLNLEKKISQLSREQFMTWVK